MVLCVVAWHKDATTYKNDTCIYKLFSRYQCHILITYYLHNYDLRIVNKFNFKLYLFYNITKQVIKLILIMLVGTNVCVRMDFVWEETGAHRRKPTCLTWWPHDHLICRRRVSNPGRSGERRVRLSNKLFWWPWPDNMDIPFACYKMFATELHVIFPCYKLNTALQT